MSLLHLNLLTLAVLLATTAHAAERVTPQGAPQKPGDAAAHALAPAQINAIRAIGRSVLAAKKSGTDDPADAAQLARLRASLDRLIAVDLDPRNRLPITLQGEESTAQRKAHTAVAELRATARSDAQALAAQLRERASLMASRARTDAATDTTSAGFPMGEQRARLFERWAQQLDAALVDDNPERVGQLRELRGQLQASQGGLTNAPLAHGTPTLQAMPAGYVPPATAVME